MPKKIFEKGNPGGGNSKKHPNGYLTVILKKILENKISINDSRVAAILADDSNPKKQTTVKQAILARLAYNAMDKGDNEAIKEILNRADGKVKEQIEYSGNIINVNVNNLDKKTEQELLNVFSKKGLSGNT